MFRRTTFTTITPLPPSLSRDVVVTFLHEHLEMIDLNPLVKERHPIPPPPHAEPEEQTCVWYSLTDKISYLPGDLLTGDVTYTCAFRDVPDGVQTHCYAPAGLSMPAPDAVEYAEVELMHDLDIRESWTVQTEFHAGPGLGAPPEAALFIREEVDMRCNMLLTAFVRRTLKKSHASLVERLKVRAHTASKAAPGTTTVGVGKTMLYGSGESSSTAAGESAGEGHVRSHWTTSGPRTERGATTASPGASELALSPGERRLRTPSPNPGGVSVETMQYYRHWESPSSPPPPPRKDSPPPSKDRPMSDSQRRASPRQATPDPAHRAPPPPPPKDRRADDPPNTTSLPAESQQLLDTPQLLTPHADQQPPSGPGRSPSTAGLVPAPLRIRSRSPPLQRVENPPMGSPPPLATAGAAAAAAAPPQQADDQAIPEVRVLEDSPIGARLKGPFIAQLP